MSSFRAASLVSVTEVDGLIISLSDQIVTCEAQRGMLSMRLHSNTRSETTSTLLGQVELSIRDLKSAMKELEEEKTKLVAARKQAQQCKDADKKRRAPAPATKPGTKLGKYVVPEWISGRSPALLVARKEGKVVQTIDLAKKDCFVLGRQPELCHIVLEHASVSRQHVVIIHGDPAAGAAGACQWHIVDLGSAHGTGIGPLDTAAAAAAPAPDAAPEEKKTILKRLKPDTPTALPLGTSFRIGKSSRVYTIEADDRANKKRKGRTFTTTAGPAPSAAVGPSAAAPAAGDEVKAGDDMEDDDSGDEDDDDEDEGEAAGGMLGSSAPSSKRPAPA